MKCYLILLAGLILSTLGCQKNIDSSMMESAAQTADNVTASLAPLNAHVATFFGPPNTYSSARFAMSKTFYSDKRVASLIMTSLSAEPFFYEWNEKFVYSANKATMTGKRLMYYYDVQRFLNETFTDPVEFTFNQYNYCTSVVQRTPTAPVTLVKLFYNTSNPNFVFLTNMIFYYPSFSVQYGVQTDLKGNITAVKNGYKRGIKYAYSSTAKSNYFYEPSQDAVDQWFSLLETMQWVPQPKNERISFTSSWGNDGSPSSPEYNVQTRLMRNQKYDAKGSLISYDYDNTYDGPNPRKISWKY